MPARCGVLFELSAPHNRVARRQFHLSLNLVTRVLNGARKIAPFNRVLQTNVAGIVLPIYERGALVDLECRHFSEWYLRSTGRRDQDIANLVRCLTKLRLQSHNEIEQTLALNHLSRRGSANGRLDQSVDIGDVEPITSHLRAICRYSQRRLPKLPNESHLLDAGHSVQHAFDLAATLLKDIQVSTKDLGIERALQPSLCFIHRIFGGLRVVERDAGKSAQLLVDRGNQRWFRVIFAVPVTVWLEPHVELSIEEAGGVRAVVWTAML